MLGCKLWPTETINDSVKTLVVLISLCSHFRSKANRCPPCSSVHICHPGRSVYVCSDCSYYVCHLQEARLVTHTFSVIKF